MTSEIAHTFLDHAQQYPQIVGAQLIADCLEVFSCVEGLVITGSFMGRNIVVKFVGELLVEQSLTVV